MIWRPLPREGQFVIVRMRRGALRGCIYRRERFYDAWSNQLCLPQPVVWFVPELPLDLIDGPPPAGLEPPAAAGP